ncbi:50S ribosomal protein L22 [Chondrinema litorale]|uniref:50S ribosomal protein L22 n=1 Tax=Chondrinema litorale TaxID=2994555 RepID=UPI0025449D96|nr:50S ribosomal protein L22 [Chondrinema litorale]UZR92774.1 50S ribosomal protein L22 [Chondrinema litorale]
MEQARAILRNVRIAPRKMRLVVDLIRGKKVSTALNILKFESKAGAQYIEKLLLSAISNWENKNPDASIEDADLYVKEVYVTQGKTLKRFRPAPQGRAHRIRKRSNHVTLIVDSLNDTSDEGVSEAVVEDENKD